jgi:hypothetical protein
MGRGQGAGAQASQARRTDIQAGVPGEAPREVLAQQPRWAELAARLNEISVGRGDARFVARFEEDIDALLERGEALEGTGALMVPGEPISCHGNVARLCEDDDSLAAMTGWALSDDGGWRQHSWCRRREDGQILETTVDRVAYFGFELDEDELEEFVFENAW